MKVLLINPNRSYPAGKLDPNIGLPLGLLYVAATLEQEQHQVSILDCLLSARTRIFPGKEWISLGLSEDEIRAQLREENPDVVGIGCMFTAQWSGAARMIELVDETLPQCPIVVGGPHATVAAREVLENHPQVDFVIAGEGELSMPLLVKAIQNQKPEEYKTVPGLSWRGESGAICVNPSEKIRDLDVLPLPAYHLMGFDRLFELQKQGLYARDHAFKSASLITSRGCPYTCTFCSIHLSMGRWWRPHSVDYVVRHIKLLTEQYGVRHLHIEDDNFTFRANRASEICKRLIDEKIRLTWDTPNGIRADTLTDELVGYMKKSGCIGIDVAAESGDQHVVTNIIKKHIDLQSIENAAALGKKHGLRMRCFFVIGFPGETKENINQTLRFAQRLFAKYNCAPMLNVATPLPGTVLATQVQKEGYLVTDILPQNLIIATLGTKQGHGMIKTPEFDPEYIRRCCARLHRNIRLLRARRLLTHPGEIIDVFRRRALRYSRRHPLQSWGPA